MQQFKIQFYGPIVLRTPKQGTGRFVQLWRKCVSRFKPTNIRVVGHKEGDKIWLPIESKDQLVEVGLEPDELYGYSRGPVGLCYFISLTETSVKTQAV